MPVAVRVPLCCHACVCQNYILYFKKLTVAVEEQKNLKTLCAYEVKPYYWHIPGGTVPVNTLSPLPLLDAKPYHRALNVMSFLKIN
jgi:hypothetical protein